MAVKTKKKSSVYSVHPAVAMVQGWIAALPEKTGKSFEQWIKLIQKSGPATEKERSAWLKKEHGFGSNQASWLANRASGGDAGIGEEDPEAYLAAAVGYVEAMFAGPKAGLRPIYDRLLKMGLALGKDVKACPCTTIVPLYRNHVFAQLKPSTRTRLDLGLALGKLVKEKKPIPKRLIDTGGFEKKDRITHRIAVESVEEVDEEVERWLTRAYELDGE